MFNKKPYFEFRNAQGKSAKVTIKGDGFIIGSGAQSHLKISSDDVSAEHITLQRRESGWVAQAKGHTPAYINSLPFDIQTLSSRDIVQIGSSAFRFVDPEQEKQDAALAKAEEPGLLEELSKRPKLSVKDTALAVFFVGGSVFLLLVYLFSSDEVEPIDLHRNSPETVASIMNGEGTWGGKPVVSFGQCILASYQRLSKVGWPSKIDRQYWELAKKYGPTADIAGLNNDESFKELKTSLNRGFLAARKFESIGSDKKAKKIYTEMLFQVPEKRCPVNILALARSNKL